MHEKNCVVVGFGKKPTASERKLVDKLTIYFQKQQVSGGCDVSTIQLDTSGSRPTALVIFEDDEAVRTVLLTKNHTLDIDGQNIPIHVERFIVADEHTAMNMESDDYSLSLDSWVDLAEGAAHSNDDPDLYPEVHSDDDLYSSSMLSPNKPSSQEVPTFPETRSSPSGQSREAWPASSQTPSSSNAQSFYPTGGQGTFDQTKRSGDPRQRNKNVPRDSSQDLNTSSMNWDGDKSPTFSTDSNSPLSSPKRPRTMDDIETERGGRNGQNSRNGRGERYKQLPKKKLALGEQSTEPPHGDGKSNKHGYRGGHQDSGRDLSRANPGNEISKPNKHVFPDKGHDESGQGAAGVSFDRKYRDQGNPRKPPFHDTPPYQQSRPSKSGPSHAEIPTEDEEEDLPSATVEVTNINPATSEDTLEMYFESRRRSGGGTIVSTTSHGNSATITFEDPAVAASVANRAHRLEGADLTVILVKMKKPRPKRPTDRHRLLLTDIPEGTSEEKLLLFIEGRTKIEEDPEIMFGEIPGTAMLRYSVEIQDMEKVIDNFKKKPLQKQIVSASSVDFTDCILVQDLTPSLTEDTVELYFECERKSGGGIVREIQMDEEKKRAIVFFEDWKVVDRVIRQKHTLSKPQLHVSPYFDNLGVIVASYEPTPRIPASVANLAPRLEGADLNAKRVKKKKPRPKQPTEERDERDLPSTTVEVTNINPETSQDTLEMYFESRRSCGGTIVSKTSRGNSATITFEDPTVAASVANRAHRLEGADLTVILVKMKKPRPKRPTVRHRLLLTEIPDGTKEETLLLFIEGRTKIEEDPEIMYGKIPGTAMLHYSVEIQDMEKVIDNFKKKPFKKQIVSASSVDYPDCILVQNLTPSITEDAVELYFESERKSGGGIVREIQMDEKKKLAIVFFEDWRVVERVIRKKHTLSKTQLHVSAYFDNLGVIVASDGPISHIPDPIVVQIDPAVAEFVLDAGSSHRARVDSVILDEKGRLMWPGNGQINLVEIIPVTSGSDPNCWVDWSSRVKSRLFDIMNEFKSDNIVVDEDLWNDVCNKLQGLNLGNVRPLLKSDQATIILRGPCAEVENTMTRLACVVKDLEAEAERARQIVRKVVKLNEEKFKHLFLCNIKEELDKKWQLDVRIMQSENPHELIFEGMRSESAEAVLDMYTQLENLVKHDFEFSPNKVRFVKQEQDKIHEILNSRNIHAATAIDIESNKVTITGAADQDTRLAYHFIQNDIVEASVKILNQATVKVLKTPKGRTCLAEVNKSRTVLAAVVPDKHSIELTGFKADVQQASSIIQDFIEKNAILQEHIPLVRGKVKYLMEYANSELQSISEHNSQSTVDIRPVPGGPQCGFTVSGTEQGLKLAVKSVKSLSEKIVERQYPVAKPGMPELLRASKGKKLLNNLSKELSCFIDSNSDAVEVSVSGPVIDVEELRRITANNGVDLVVCKGDLTREKVDAIVNAANVDLKHIGGLAGDILKKGGSSIQDESRDIIQKNGGPLRVAEAVFSRPGKLPCQHIIHVAGPRWERGPPIPSEDPTTEEDLLHDSVRNVLREASRKNLTSISIPAISSGVYGFPIDLCAKTVVEAAFEFCRRRTTLKEIRFTNIDKRACDAFLAVFQAQFGDEQGSSDKLDFGGFSDRDDFGSFRGATSMDFSSPGPSFSTPTPATTSLVSLVSRDIISTKEKKTITLKRGDIATENVNVIVNTTGSSMNLNSGGVSKAILAAGGPILQQQCKQVMTQRGIQNVAPGDFIEAGPGNLNCQRVIHCVGAGYQGPSSEALLRSLMQKILQQANQSGCQSIAIPAIGTGTLAFPHDIVAQIMYDEVITFSQQNAAGSLIDIRFVVYHRDQPTIKAFEDEMQSLLQGTTGASGIQPAAPAAPTRRLKSQKDSQKTRRSSVSGDERAFGTVKSANDGSLSIQIGHITVQLQNGDLTQENTDAIVNSAGHDLSLNGPVSKAIVKAGGKEIARECKQLVDKGHKNINRDAVKTTAGRLPCRCIIHVVTPHTGAHLKSVVLKALQLAENDGMRSIAFPALGTGRVGGNAATAASVLLDAIGEFATNTGKKSLQIIKLTIFQAAMLPDFAEAMRAKENTSYKPQKGFLRKVSEYVLSKMPSLSGVGEGEMIEAAAWEEDGEPETLILRIFAKDAKTVEEAVDRIDEFINDEYCSEEVPYEEEMWGELDTSKMDDIFTIAQKNNVRIEPMLHGRAKRIIIQGRAVDVLKARADIQEMFTKIHMVKKKQAEDQLINKEVQWRYKDTTSVFTDYGDELNPIIERAHRSQKTHVDLELEEGTIRIDFFSMEERQPKGRGKTTVHRADLKKEQTSFNLPTNWIPMTGQNSVTVPLTQGSQEFVQVQTAFQNSLRRAPVIHKIERVQVLDLYKSYVAKMERIKTSLPAGMPAERPLFHGTTHDTCDKVNRHGFNRSYCGKNGTAHGNGTYFARDASYSDGYAQPSGPNKYKHMYMCNVLTGEYTQGQAGMVSPPPKTNSPNEMYDCVVDNVRNPGVFVVFHDAQAYPEYLILYT